MSYLRTFSLTEHHKGQVALQGSAQNLHSPHPSYLPPAFQHTLLRKAPVDRPGLLLPPPLSHSQFVSL